MLKITAFVLKYIYRNVKRGNIMSEIIYTLEGGIYFNITNKCPCSCSFCIRSKGEAVGDAKRLWHDAQPTFEDVKAAIDNYDFHNAEEVVFCGYGEPTSELDLLLKTAGYLKSLYPSMILYPFRSMKPIPINMTK